VCVGIVEAIFLWRIAQQPPDPVRLVSDQIISMAQVGRNFETMNLLANTPAIVGLMLAVGVVSIALRAIAAYRNRRR
jgi:hypothetical protein